MKKIVRLTESDLIRLVKRVINEQSSTREQDVENFCKQNNIPQIKLDSTEAYWEKETENFTISINNVYNGHTILFVYKDIGEYDRTVFVKKVYNDQDWNFEEFKKLTAPYIK
jgi:hypothetical protein